ncbi:ABC transporter ATP-binding protein [Lentilactobacillus farraginis]|uniref:ABC superfamily ATP binding cassette transporter, ABC protein n=1 Tax=Lentilactobacillus farraginis DSM 18382 = JCM 14108 TaxID=1423743 RepID=X0QCE3_9LACO|nr:ABC transporter ATP-binding protein [Lentilactobacillus farraginis]KRM10933.1 ABC superfamily ATP binding cassette transporter, ABC protein [Lentilactobacillus farraginis DSM 18382 = JCM 14108]GAF36280.1 ABC transporter, ATP-binding protein [Lentilactobacillus farraginis DSM 18382 = JCM 14108]
MIEVNQLSLVTRVPILNDFSYQFKTGNICLISAVNGSGKTTFFRALTNLIKHKHGTIRFDGQPFKKEKQAVFFYETPDWLDGNLSGLDYLKFVQRQWRSPRNLNEEINFWKMADYIRLPIKKYSLGMKQHLVIAMYFCSNATYLIMDEISNGLDEESRKRLYDRIKDAAVNEQKCVIISSHYKSDVAVIATRILHLENQKIIAES